MPSLERVVVSSRTRERAEAFAAAHGAEVGESDADVVVFKSNGIAPWDLAIAYVAVRRARERGLGTDVPG